MQCHSDYYRYFEINDKSTVIKLSKLIQNSLKLSEPVLQNQ